MDFHSLARRDLQALCKKNKIPANLTNMAMADALKSLKSIELDEEIKQKLMPQSETIEQNRSPLPGSRRVAARFSMEMDDREEEMKKEALIEGNQTPATAVRRSSRLQSAMSTRTRARTSATTAGTVTSAAGTRTRKGKKEEAPAEAVDFVVVETPAPRRGRKKAVETPSEVVAPRSSARPLRQSTRRLAESTNRASTTRTMAKITTLDPEDDKEATVVEELELEKEQTAVLEDVTELGEATEPNSAEKLELFEDLTDQNKVNEVSEETEQAKQTENVDLGRVDELVSDEKVNLEEHITVQIESAEENIEEGITESTEENIEGFDINADIPQDKSNTETDGSDESTEEELKEIPAEKAEDAEEEKLNSNASEEQGDELKDENESVEKSVEEVTEVGSVTNAALISEEGQVAPEEESEVNLTVHVDSPILGLVSEVMPENNSDLQDVPSFNFTLEPPTETCIISPIIAPADQVCLADSLVTENNSEPSHDIIALDAQVAPSDLCFSSPVRAPTDQGVEKMLDSVVRHFARASINDSFKKIDACAGQKEENDKVVIVSDVSELVQNENADKSTVDLNCMSLRKLKALYKNKLIEVNSAKVVEEGKRLPLGKLDENLLV